MPFYSAGLSSGGRLHLSLISTRMGDTHFSWLQIIVRLTAALAAGGAIGLDREWLRKPAGLKTHMLFALACAMMSITAVDIDRKSVV